jgi:hypothetical protein
MGEESALAELRAFKSLQELYMSARDVEEARIICEHLSQLIEPFDLDVDAIVSVAGSRFESSEPLARCIAAAADAKLRAQINAAVEAAPSASALSGFAAVWLSATRTGQVDGRIADDGSGPIAADVFEAKLATAIAANEIAEIGVLLLGADVDQTYIKARNFPKQLVRRQARCSVLDVAVGSGAVPVAKYLLEFLGARPTRETLKMALASGNLELIRMCWGRLPAEHEKRLDLLEVAASSGRSTCVLQTHCWRCWTRDSTRGGPRPLRRGGLRRARLCSAPHLKAFTRTAAGGITRRARRWASRHSKASGHAS